MPLPGKVERPQRVTRSRRIKAESNAAALSVSKGYVVQC